MSKERVWVSDECDHKTTWCPKCRNKKVFDDEIKHQKWCKFKVFCWAFTPGWIAIILIILAIRGWVLK